jgi:putative transposase
MSYRTIEIKWLPSSPSQWSVFTAVRMEAGRLWSWLVERHATIRQEGGKWPSKADLQKEVKRQFPDLSAQSTQQTIGDFCESISSASALRKNGREVEYPHKKPRYRQVIFTNQDAKVRSENLILPCSKAGKLSVRIPDGLVIPGRIMEVRLDYGCVQIVCKVEDVIRVVGPTIGVDLGVNSLIAATDGEKAVVISGREVKATVQFRNKQLAEIQTKLSSKEKGSKRYRRLQRRKYRMLDHAKNKVRDLCHKATRKVADAFPNAKAYVGKPFNDAARKMRPKQAQTVSSACNRKIIDMLNYKLVAAIEVNEAYSSQTCPTCGERSKHRREYRCRCGATAPRDVVGAINIRAIGIEGEMEPGRSLPKDVQFVHPSKYPGVNRVVPQDTGQVARIQPPRTPRL